MSLPPAFEWTNLPAGDPERIKKVKAYLKSGAAIGIGQIEWDTIYACMDGYIEAMQKLKEYKDRGY